MFVGWFIVVVCFFFSSRRRHTRCALVTWSSDVCSSDLEDDGTPIEGIVSSQIKLWDNGTRINQAPGETVMHPGTAEAAPGNITEVDGTDAQGNAYVAASELMEASLEYDGNSRFKLTISNTSGSTANPTPFSPGVWAISYIAGTDILNPNPLYEAGKPSVNGLTNVAEMGDVSELGDYVAEQTGIFTPLSPVLVVVYKDEENPIYKMGEKDSGEGLKEIERESSRERVCQSV